MPWVRYAQHTQCLPHRRHLPECGEVDEGRGRQILAPQQSAARFGEIDEETSVDEGNGAATEGVVLAQQPLDRLAAQLYPRTSSVPTAVFILHIVLCTALRLCLLGPTNSSREVVFVAERRKHRRFPHFGQPVAAAAARVGRAALHIQRCVATAAAAHGKIGVNKGREEKQNASLALSPLALVTRGSANKNKAAHPAR